MRNLEIKYSTFGVILLGFLLFGLKEFAEVLFHPLQSFFATIGLLLIFITPFFVGYKPINPLQGKIRVLYYLFLIWILIIISFPFFTGQNYSQNSIHPYAIYGLSSYLLPIIVLLGTRNLLPEIFKTSYLFALIGFVFFVLNFENMQTVLASGIMNSTGDELGINNLANRYYYWFSISSLSLLCYEFISKKYKWIAILSNFFMLFLMTYFARRGGIFMFIMYFLGTFYLYIFESKKGTKILKISFFLLVCIFTAATYYRYADTTFALSKDRINEDSRTGVDESLVHYLNAENAWFFGKGIEGAYPQKGYDEPRYGHETGYLHLILKGGIVYLSLYCFLLIHSAYLGFFKTNNRLTKALALYLFFHVIFLVPFGVPSFSLEYLFLWMGVAFCQSKHWRFMTNEQIKYFLVKNN